MQQVTDDLKSHLCREIDINEVEKTVVGAVIFAPEGLGGDRVLLLKRAQHDFLGGLVELPSGGVDEAEDLVAALKREVAEETGLLETSLLGYLGSFDYVSGSGKKARQLNFVVRARSADITIAAEEHSGFFWMTAEEVRSSDGQISDETKAIVLEAFNAVDGNRRR